jgi:(R,R)-butanediol dehydrogenase/meso-butanediol dehydrogenase/diacetyl reductase
MRAAVYKGERVLEVEEIPTPTAGAGEVVVRVRYCAVCGTDVHAFMYDVAPPGTVMGHEYCGTVTEVGEGVTRWQVGDRVVGGGGNPPPGYVPSGPRNDPRYNYRTMGFPEGAKTRAYAEYVQLEDWEPMPIPDGVSDEEAALAEPCAVTVHAVRLSQIKLGDRVLVMGAGPIGLFCMQTARAAGATSVFVSEPAPARAEAARRLGADAVINPFTENVEERLVELTGGKGPDIVFECAAVPNPSTLDSALNIVKRGGQVVLVAIAWEPTPLITPDWMAREVKLQASFGTQPEDWRVALELMRAGLVNVEPMLGDTNFLPLDDIQGAFESLMKPSGQVQMVVRL